MGDGAARSWRWSSPTRDGKWAWSSIEMSELRMAGKELDGRGKGPSRREGWEIHWHGCRVIHHPKCQGVVDQNQGAASSSVQWEGDSSWRWGYFLCAKSPPATALVVPCPCRCKFKTQSGPSPCPTSHRVPLLFFFPTHTHTLTFSLLPRGITAQPSNDHAVPHGSSC